METLTSRSSMGGDSIAPYWVEDIERIRADLDDVEKKRGRLFAFITRSEHTLHHLQGSHRRRVR